MSINVTTPGSARIGAFQTATLTEPTGVVSVAKITFTVLATNPSATISLSASLTDANTSQTFATVTASCVVAVTGPPPTTTTSSTPSTTTTRPPTTTTSTTTLTPISATTTTGATASLPAAMTTTTTTLPCTTARCTLGAALMSPACAGQTIPASVTGKFSTAETLIDQAATTPGKKARKVLLRARILLRKAVVRAARAAKGKRATISAACAIALEEGVNDIRSGLGS